MLMHKWGHLRGKGTCYLFQLVSETFSDFYLGGFKTSKKKKKSGFNLSEHSTGKVFLAKVQSSKETLRPLNRRTQSYLPVLSLDPEPPSARLLQHVRHTEISSRVK